MTVSILHGDCREVLRTLPDKSVHCCVTSPPYWGLRDYGVDGQIGLEDSPEAFVNELVSLFREVRRVLRADGTLWMNLGDSYAGSGRGGNPTEETSTLQGGQSSQRASMVKRGGPPSGKSTLRGNGHIGGGPKLKSLAPVIGSQLPAGFHEGARQSGSIGRAWVPPPMGLKQKDLVGTPWMVAFALRSDGWYLRQDIIWSKPNPMPESVTDRCTKAHEYIFLLSKSGKYYYNQDAILEDCSPNTNARLSQDVQNQIGSERANGGAKTNGNMKAVSRQSWKGSTFDGPRDLEVRPDTGRKRAPTGSGTKNNDSFDAAMAIMPTKRNKRSVWTVTTEGFKEAHFATFPPALIEPCILAGCPEGGTVLDPFGGAGTTGMVADRLQRNAILIELNPEYAAMAERRIRGDAGMFAEIGNAK